MKDTTRTTTPQAGSAAEAELRAEIRALRAELAAQRHQLDDLLHGLATAFSAAGVANPMTAFRVVDGQGSGRSRRSTRPALTLVASSQLGA